MEHHTHTIWSQIALCYDSLKQTTPLSVPLLLKSKYLLSTLISGTLRTQWNWSKFNLKSYVEFIGRIWQILCFIQTKGWLGTRDSFEREGHSTSHMQVFYMPIVHQRRDNKKTYIWNVDHHTHTCTNTHNLISNCIMLQLFQTNTPTLIWSIAPSIHDLEATRMPATISSSVAAMMSVTNTKVSYWTNS